MVKIGLQLKATLENLTSLKADGEDFRWYIKVKCLNCGEETKTFIYLSLLENSPLKGGRGHASMVSKCKLCGRENSIDIVKESIAAYNIEDVGSFKTIVVFECRGMEPTEYSARTGWSACGAETNVPFEVDLTEGDWCDYDERASASVVGDVAMDIPIQNGVGGLHVNNLQSGQIKSSLFSGIILAYWDNIMGPMVSKIWKGNEKVVVNMDIIKYVSNHTLSGELCRQTEQNTIDPKFYVLADLGYVFFSVIFNGFSEMGQTLSSLSFVMSYEDMKRYLMLEDYITKQVRLIILKYRVLQRKDLSTAVKYFSRYLKELIKSIDSLENLSIPLNICVNETIFGEIEEANDVQLLDSRFLMRSITSHLQTCGCTIVVGKTVEKVNLLLHTLALFSSPKERYCSRRSSMLEKYLFSKDFWLQGILNDDTEVTISESSKDILLNSFPITLINADEKTVQQTSPLNQHAKIRENFIKLELSMLLQGEDPPVYPILKLFTDEIGDISILVQQFINDLFANPIKCSIRKKHLQNFLAMLKQKALAFIAYVEAKSNMGKQNFNSNQVYQLKRDLSLNSEPDFRIVLATAEKMRPGLAAFLIGDIVRRDEQYQAVLEDF